jgi:hypothetical protein
MIEMALWCIGVLTVIFVIDKAINRYQEADERARYGPKA